MQNEDEMLLERLLGRLVRNDFPWDQAWTANFNEFDDRFTLHDSGLIGVVMALRGYNETVLVIEWDGHWLPEPLRSECLHGQSKIPDWPYLFVRISEVLTVRHDGYKDPCDGRSISQTVWTDQNEIKLLEIRDIIDGSVRITYAGRTEFLAMDSRDGRVLDLETNENSTDDHS